MAHYRIHRFSKLTGLSTHVIRAWERRYNLVKPERSANRYRLYTDEDVGLFRYLKQEIDKGNSIGELAEVGREELLAQAKIATLESFDIDPPSDRLVGELVEAIKNNDRVAFERKLNGAVAVIPFEEALLRFLLPLQERMGQLWHDGVVGTAQEHYATNQVKQKIFTALNQLRIVDHGPKVVIACPENEPHEIGAQTVAYLSKSRGCRTYYLGGDLPVEDLALYCEQVRPALTLLSLVIPPSKLEAKSLAQDLSEKVSRYCPVGIGGQGAVAYAEVFEKEDISVFRSLKELEIRLLTLSIP